MSTAEVNQSLGGGGGDGGGDWPKASIGNYKGVMLCNRPNEFGQQKRPERTGLEPFNSRVTPGEPLGWNPSMKLLPRQAKKKSKYCQLSPTHRRFPGRQPQQHPRAPQKVPPPTREAEGHGAERSGGEHRVTAGKAEAVEGPGGTPARQDQKS